MKNRAPSGTGDFPSNAKMASVELKQRRGKGEEKIANSTEDEVEAEQNEPILVELGDCQAIKTALDDSVVQVCIDHRSMIDATP